MRYLESLHIMLQTIVDNTDNRIHILLSAIFNLMVKVNSILDQKAKDLKFKCYAEYYDHQ